MKEYALERWLLVSLAMAIAVALASSAAGDAFAGNNSSIYLQSQSNISAAPVSLSVGSGYYSSHPVGYGSGIGSRTQVANGRTATSLDHEVSFGRAIDSKNEFAASETVQSIYGPGYSESWEETTTHMKIDENIVDGKVHIGVLQGSASPGHAWRDPAVEMDEDYAGTFQIFKNITASSDRQTQADDWLLCCSWAGGMPREPHLLNEEDVFSFRSARPS